MVNYIGACPICHGNRAAYPQAPSGQQAEPTIKYVPAAINSHCDGGCHPNDKEPRNDACDKALDDRGDSEGQGLDPYWKWGFRAGFNAALAGHQSERPAPAGQAVGEAVHWRAVLAAHQVPHQLRTDLHFVGFGKQRAAESWIAEQKDFGGWEYTLEPLYLAPQAALASSQAERPAEGGK